jgi:hypothetical protein
MVLSLSREQRGGDQNYGVYLEAGSRAGSEFIIDLISGFEVRWQASMGLLDYLTIQFIPDSAQRSSGQLTFDISSDRALDVGSLRVMSEPTDEVRVTETGDLTYRVHARDCEREQRFMFNEATSSDHAAWLRHEVAILIPRRPSLIASCAGRKTRLEAA